MAKMAGSTRVPHWGSTGNSYEGDLFFFNGQRRRFKNLPDDMKRVIWQVQEQIAKEMWQRLKNVKTPQFIDGKPVVIEYVHRDVIHAARDMMVVLSGKYFSRESMLRINETLEKAEYIPTPHNDKEDRKDGRKMWFKYKDTDGRGVYFGVSKIMDGRYTLHTITDRSPEETAKIEKYNKKKIKDNTLK